MFFILPFHLSQSQQGDPRGGLSLDLVSPTGPCVHPSTSPTSYWSQELCGRVCDPIISFLLKSVSVIMGPVSSRTNLRVSSSMSKKRKKPETNKQSPSGTLTRIALTPVSICAELMSVLSWVLQSANMLCLLSVL